MSPAKVNQTPRTLIARTTKQKTISADSCNGVKCDQDKICVLKKGHPKCVCSSRCRVGKSLPKGPVCGTDGRSYRNVCRLRKRACRNQSNTLFVDYNGNCQGERSGMDRFYSVSMVLCRITSLLLFDGYLVFVHGTVINVKL